MRWWLLVLVIANVSGHDKSHNCIHDKIDHQILSQHVKYNNHPLDSTNPDRRQLLKSGQYQPIRIRPYYDPVLCNGLSTDTITYIKSLVSTSIHYLEQFVNVIPIHGPLFINRCQRLWHYRTFTYNACPLSDYSKPLKCQYAIIPEAHLAESWYYDPLTLKSTLYKEAGTGITDADLIIYVSSSSAECADDGSTLAWASICNLDQFGRPISGTINFCPGALDTMYWKFDVGVTLHEIMHILAMSNTLFPYFYNWSTGTFFNQETVVINPSVSGLDNVYIITDKVQQVSRLHFGCDTLVGAPLENTGADGTIGSHWESKYLQSELMCGMMYSAVLYLSDFTLALMEDSGWYSIDYEYSDAFTWGHNEGCAFFQAHCISKSSSSSNFEQYWCTSAADNGCSYDYSTAGQCVNQLSGSVPVQFKYYSDPSFGGPQSHDYCAFRYQSSNTMYHDYEEICWDIRGNIYSRTPQYPTSSFGINSRCIEIKDGTNKNGYCFKHQCIEYDVIQKRYKGVRVLLNDYVATITCSRTQALEWIESSYYGVSIKCPNVDSICGKTSRPFSCYWGHWSDTLQTCICSVGYIGSDCSMQDINRLSLEAVVATATAADVLSLPAAAGICITDSIKSVINGFYVYDGQHEGVASYREEITGTLYLYYLRYYAQWNIANSKGDLSIYAYCAHSIALDQTINIEDCKLWAVWDNNYGWLYDVAIGASYCRPTYDPTPFPTTSPTVAPSFAPTLPSDAPSSVPTVTPSRSPTIAPTDTPNFTPTVAPTFTPSYDPTVDPTVHPTDFPTDIPTFIPSTDPTIFTTFSPTNTPTIDTLDPTDSPTDVPTKRPTRTPTQRPTEKPTPNPTNSSVSAIEIASELPIYKTPKGPPYAPPASFTTTHLPIIHPSVSVSTSTRKSNTTKLRDTPQVLVNDNRSNATVLIIICTVGFLAIAFGSGFICNRCVRNKSYCCSALKPRGFSSISRRDRFVFNDTDNNADNEHTTDGLIESDEYDDNDDDDDTDTEEDNEQCVAL